MSIFVPEDRKVNTSEINKTYLFYVWEVEKLFLKI